MKHILFYLAFQFFAQLVYSQDLDSLTKISISVRATDSQYMAFVTLKVLEKHKKISIKRNRRYVNEIDDPNADVFIYFKYKIGNFFFNIYLDVLRSHGLFFENKYDTFDFSKNFRDTINLTRFIPLEKGHYKIMIKLKYLEKGKTKEIFSDWYDFEVEFRQPYSLFY